jgi:hypothetical protein
VKKVVLIAILIKAGKQTLIGVILSLIVEKKPFTTCDSWKGNTAKKIFVQGLKVQTFLRIHYCQAAKWQLDNFITNSLYAKLASIIYHRKHIILRRTFA